jgi:hypothetical protein
MGARLSHRGRGRRPPLERRDIATADLVELTTPVEGVPAGARGGVIELRDNNTAMIEITSLPLDSVERDHLRAARPAPPHWLTQPESAYFALPLTGSNVRL